MHLSTASVLRLTVVSTIALLTWAQPSPVSAHAGEPLAPHDLLHTWTLAPSVLLPLAIPGWLYFKGIYALHQRQGRHQLQGTPVSSVPPVSPIPIWRAGAFGAGLLALFAALVSPLDALAGTLFWAHMLQHVLLILVAAPLLVLGAPLVPTLWGLPDGIRRRVALTLGSWQRTTPIRTTWSALTQPLVVWGLQTIIIWLWHVPVLYEAALQHSLIHVLEHLCFLGTALLYWWTILPAGHGGEPTGVLSLFGSAMQSGGLGALLTFSRIPWYGVYTRPAAAWGLTPLEDQQLAGLIMWLPGGTVYVIAAVALLGVWLNKSATH